MTLDELRLAVKEIEALAADLPGDTPVRFITRQGTVKDLSPGLAYQTRLNAITMTEQKGAA